MFELDSVSHHFGTRQVLRDVSLCLGERRVGVIGANGSGKSTFARLLNGLLIPSTGRVRVDGLDTKDEGPEVRRRVGFVFQNPDAQIVLPTVAEDVGFGLRNRGLSPTEAEARVEAMLDRYGLAGLGDHPAHLLSGGQKQLLACCSVLIMEPTHVIFDEPTTLLDRRNARMIVQLIEELPQQVVLVTHDLDLVATCDRVIVFDEGRILADDSPAAAIAAYVGQVG